MRVGRRKIIAVAVGVLTIAAAIVAWSIGGTDLLLAVVLGTVLLGLGAVASMVVQSERRLREIAKGPSSRIDALNRSVVALGKQVQRPSEHAEALLRAIKAGHTRLELEQERRLRNQASALEAALEQQWHGLVELINTAYREEISSFESAIGGHTRNIVELLQRAERRLLGQFRHSPAEIDALLQVHRRLALDDPLPLLGGWALSPRGVLQAIDLAERPGTSLVVECGSGTSTLFLARALDLKGGSGRLVALEHLSEFVEHTHGSLKQHGLDHVAEVRHAPLEEVEVEGTSCLWYATTSISDLHEIDLLVVDGPPASTGTFARYPAYPLLRERMSSSAVILVDDLQRDDERSTVDLWLQLGELTELPALSQEQAVLRLGRESD